MFKKMEKIDVKINISAKPLKKTAAECLIDRKIANDNEIISVLQYWEEQAEYVLKIVAEADHVPVEVKNSIHLSPIIGNREANANKKMKEACRYLQEKLESLIKNSDYRRKIKESVFTSNDNAKSQIEHAEENITNQIHSLIKEALDKFDITIIDAEWNNSLFESDEWIREIPQITLDNSNFKIPFYETRWKLLGGHDEQDLKNHFKERLNKWKTCVEKALKDYVEHDVRMSLDELIEKREKSWKEALESIERILREKLDQKKEYNQKLLDKLREIEENVLELKKLTQNFDQ